MHKGSCQSSLYSEKIFLSSQYAHGLKKPPGDASQMWTMAGQLTVLCMGAKIFMKMEFNLLNDHGLLKL
jgi:hypothetical protein